MAEVLGVVSSVITVVSVAINTTHTVIRFCRGANNLQNDLRALVSELGSLHRSLDDVSACLQIHGSAKETADFEQQLGVVVTTNIVQTLRNCEQSVQQLNVCWSRRFPSKPGSDAPWFERGLKANRLGRLHEELGQIREQIQSHVSAMLLSFSILSLCHQRQATQANLDNAKANQQNVRANNANAAATRENAAAIRQVLILLKRMGPQIDQLGNCQDRLEATRRQTGAEDDTRIIDDIGALRRSSIAMRKATANEMEQRLSVSQLAAVASAASAFKIARMSSVRSQPTISNAAIDRMLSALPEEEVPEVAVATPLSPQESPQESSFARPETEKRHKSFDDALPVLVPSFPTPYCDPPIESKADEQLLSLEEFEQEMAKAVAMADELRKGPKEPFNDVDVDRVSSLLVAVGKLRWSERPRTYLVLRLIGEIRAIEGFVIEGHKDVQLPYANEEELPTSLKGPRARREFMQKQSLVLTPRSAALITGGRHTHIGNADTRFIDIQPLGVGGQGMVDKVTSKLDLQVYARKRIRKPKELSQDKGAMHFFENEIHNLKRLQHQHLVNFVGSYTDRKFVGIIMEPVADMDLKEYLSRTPFPECEMDTLRTFFGCICSAIRYLHQQNCRHKDIKPANILVKDEQVYITDFGLALDFTELTSETTMGRPMMYTHAYAAPEVAMGAKRNTKSDVWSLGCVFLDLLTVLKGCTLDEKKKFLGERGSLVDVSLKKGGLSGMD